MHRSIYKKLAFTLTEVLIALAIVGVIAGMVLPAMTNHFQTQALERSRVRMEQTLQAAVRGLFVSENKDDIRETMLYTEQTNPSNYTTTSMAFMKKYLKLSRTCTSSNVRTECFAPTYYQYNDKNKKVTYTPPYTNYKSTCATLKNGASICIRPANPSKPSITALVDLNGRKGPNVWNRDLVELDLTPTFRAARTGDKNPVIDESILINLPEECTADTWQDSCCLTNFDSARCCDPSNSYYNASLCIPQDPCSGSNPDPSCCQNSGFDSTPEKVSWCCSYSSDYLTAHPAACGTPEEEEPEYITGTLEFEDNFDPSVSKLGITSNSGFGSYAQLKKEGLKNAYKLQISIRKKYGFVAGGTVATGDDDCPWPASYFKYGFNLLFVYVRDLFRIKTPDEKLFKKMGQELLAKSKIDTKV